MTDHTDHPRFDIDSPRDWCDTDTRASNGDSFAPAYPTLDGADLSAWLASVKQTATSEPRDTDRVPAESRWPVLEEIGLAEALDQLEAVAAMNQDKHPKLKWLTYEPLQHDGKALRHLGSAMYGNRLDDDTELPHRAHAALRLLMSLGLELKQNK